MFEEYRRKVELLIQVLPYISEESDLALHGGTAINLFVRDMPRLSVDIDLTYLPIKDRETSLKDINEMLGRLKSNIESKFAGSKVDHDKERWKLIVIQEMADIKLEVNTVMRGALSDPTKMTLCRKAQEAFEAFLEMPVVPFGQLYGGKICAALDRQHPRDIFDVKYLLEEEGFSDEVRTGFIFSLVSSARPMHELLNPNFLDQQEATANQFSGMSEEGFSYQEYENIREKLVQTIRSGLSANDRKFLLSVTDLAPDWGIYDFKKFPAVQWKLHNLSVLKSKDTEKYKAMLRALEDTLQVG